MVMIRGPALSHFAHSLGVVCRCLGPFSPLQWTRPGICIICGSHDADRCDRLGDVRVGPIAAETIGGPL